MEDNNSSGNNGNKGRFSERLKKIRRDRLKFKNRNNNVRRQLIDEFFLLTWGRNVLKITLALPSVIYSNVFLKEKNNKDKVNRKKIDVNFNIEKSVNHEDDIEYKNDVKNNINDKRIKIKRIKDIDLSLMKKKKVHHISNDKIDNDVVDLELQRLQKQIIDLIKKKLVKNINEFEILQSDLYVLSQLGFGENYLDVCQHDIKEIKKLLSKIKSLKEKYDYLKDNIDFEYMLEYNDDFIMAKILELKEICSRDDIKKVVDNYKILNEYKYLYLKIDKLEEEAIKIEEYKEIKAKELKKRNINFDDLKNNIYNVDRENERYISFANQQEMLLMELESKINKIDSYEKVSYRLKGFNQLLGNSFKYLGLLLVNPLKGLIPGIATQTLVTKNIIKNLYNNLEWEENKKMVYETIDYSKLINNAINDVDSTMSLLDSTLEDIVSLKSKYINEFSKYESSFSSYKDAIKKLNKIENAVLSSKIKLDTIQIKMMEKEKVNDSKLKKVKKLNDEGI